MARMSRLLGAVCLGAAATAAVAAVVINREYSPVHRSHSASAESTAAGRVIVKFKATSATLAAATGSSGSAPRSAHILGARLGLVLADGRSLGSRTQVLHVQGMSSSALAATLAKQADVEWVQVDHKRYVQSVPNDPLYGGNQLVATPTVGQWYLRAPDAAFEDSSGTKLVSSINIEPAWAITHGSSSIVIGDVDTGITTHPELTGSVDTSSADSKVFPATFSGTTSTTAYGYDFVGYASSDDQYALATANDGNLDDADPSDPGDWVSATDIANNTLGSNCTAADEQDSSWHGTQTAGILAAATNNGQGMAGVGYDTKIVPARALGKCGGYDSDIIAAGMWAGGLSVGVGASGHAIPTNTHPARVINMSLGGSGVCATDAPAYVDALTALRNNKVVVVAAAGNDEGLAVSIPANCQPAANDSDQTPIVVAVAAVRHVGDKVGFSDIGPEVTLAAPGGNCVNTATDAACLYPILTTANSGKTTPVSGTAGPTYTTSFGDSSLGTSFSTPMVAGTVALMMSVAPNMSNANIISILKQTARPFPLTGGTANTPVCTAPSKTAQDECYCTTSTCGAGMLDAGRAVAAAVVGGAATATITPGSSSAVVGGTTTLSGASSTGSNGSLITSYQWAIDSADTVVTLSGTTGASITATAATAGTAQVELTVTDANGLQSSTSTTITVTAAAPAAGASASSGGGGGGGGAANPAWLAALALAGLLLAPRARRRRG